jgi:hypothetical protein
MRHAGVAGVILAGAILSAAAKVRGDDACLVGFELKDVGKIATGTTVPGVASNRKCVFNLGLCVDQRAEGCAPGEIKGRKIRAKGHCGGIGKLSVVPNGTSAVCTSDGGSFAQVVVKTKRKGTKAGQCTLRVTAKTKDKRTDRDTLALTCSPEPVTCEPLVSDGQGIPGTYRLLSVKGPNLCQTNSTQNRFGQCTQDADCGGVPGSCTATPFATAGGFGLPFPEGIKTVFTLASAASAPTCDHAACIACGNAGAACAGIPGCGVPPAAPTDTCCDTPGFTIPTFVVPIAGGLCSRLDQIACGAGVVNTSNPQVGDNEVTKFGDTSDPGPDCRYGTADDPPPKACTATGEGADVRGKVVRTVGNAAFDPAGINYRLAVPALSSTWIDTANPCPQGSTFDGGNEILVSQIILNTDYSTAGATAGFVDLNGDGCARAGAGFPQNGPITIGSPPASPQPYDGSAGSVAASAGVALSGSGPLNDLGFVAILPNGPITRVSPTESCTCTPAAGCPE